VEAEDCGKDVDDLRAGWCAGGSSHIISREVALTTGLSIKLFARFQCAYVRRVAGARKDLIVADGSDGFDTAI